MSRRRALVTGATGQDGSYLCEHLLAQGYEVHGTVRPSTGSLEHSALRPLVEGDDPLVALHTTDLADASSLMRVVAHVRPHEVYNLAAQSQVSASFKEPLHTGDVTGFGVVRLLDAIRQVDGDIRFYQAGSSEMFGATPPPQHEYSPFHPRSPYAVAKVYAHYATINYREAYGLHASNGILFNHESPRRGTGFVTRKITRAVPRILAGQQRVLKLGNLDVWRDWGHARDYVEAMVLITQQDKPTDLCIGTGESHSLREFLELAFAVVDRDWRDHVEIDPDLYRPADVPHVRCDPTRAWGLLGWKARTSFEDLVREMVEADLVTFRSGAA